MPEVARCNTIEVGEPVLRAGSKIEACDQVKQTLKGAIRDRDRQKVPRQKLRYSCRRGKSATGTRPVARARPCSKLRVFAGRSERSASRGAAAKATHASRSCQPLRIMEEATDLYSRPRLRSIVNFASLRRWLCSYPYTPEAILLIRDLLRGKLRFRSQPFERGKSLRRLGAWSESYWLAIKSAQAASIRKTPRCLASLQILGQQRNSLRFEVSGDVFRVPAEDYVDFGMLLQFFKC